MYKGKIDPMQNGGRGGRGVRDRDTYTVDFRPPFLVRVKLEGDRGGVNAWNHWEYDRDETFCYTLSR